mgnify:CR=1 FL=1
MKKSVLKQYARLIARTGANVQKGQSVLIVAGLDQPEFIELLAAECYRAGASEVEVEWRHQPLTRLAVRYKSAKKLGEVKAWEEEKQKWQAENLPARIVVLSEDPDGLTGINQAKYAKGMQARYQKLRPYIDARENREQWCIAAVPGVKWAKKVFPELPKGRAVEKLWEVILSCSRALEGDPEENWRLHNLELKARADRLNAMGLVSLEYRSANGTDLKVGLIPEALFLGGAERCPVNGVLYDPNIPSEELFITPKAGSAEGIVHATMPLVFQGILIEDFWLRFEGGKVTELHAEKNEEALRTLVSMDEGAAMLGECALVPYESPIRESGILFYNTLFDENAACHFAFGNAYPCIEGAEAMDEQQRRARGLNASITHVDFMVGTADLSVTGILPDGGEAPVMRDGVFAL